MQFKGVVQRVFFVCPVDAFIFEKMLTEEFFTVKIFFSFFLGSNHKNHQF